MENNRDNNDDEGSQQPLLGTGGDATDSTFVSYAQRKRQARALLASNAKHYVVMCLVALDVTAILADIFIALVACDLKLEGAGWVTRTREGLHIFALVFSSLFLVELLVAVWAFGRRYVSRVCVWLATCSGRKARR